METEQNEPEAKLSIAQEWAAAGARLLDERIPDWEVRINLNELRMYDTHWCVLGQLFRDAPYQDQDPYFVGRSALLGSQGIQRAGDLGFDARPGATFEQLQEAWENLIQERREAKTEREEETSNV